MASEHTAFFSPRRSAGEGGALLLWQRGSPGIDDRIAFLDGWSGAAPLALPPVPVVRWGARVDQPLTDAMAASDGLGLAYPSPLSFLADDGGALFRPHQRAWTQGNETAGTFLRGDGRLEVATEVTAFPHSAAFRLQSTARVLTAPAVSLHRFSAAHAPLPPWVTEVTAYAGDWSGEFRPTTVPLGPSGFSWQRSAGRSDHHRYPALLCSEGALAADRGRVLAVILAASGDHELRIDQRVDGTFMVQGGAYLNPGDGRLEAGEALTTPALWFVFSEHGTNGLRQQIHALQRSEAFPQSGFVWPRPVHLNSWEALYFDVSEQALLELVASAKALGVERFVVDD
ncbi:MAG: alpha-galactosidase, partial [Pseudomonadota bacterium]|nr:alpha-galactosidase [Pseudomonadota bacterium]